MPGPTKTKFEPSRWFAAAAWLVLIAIVGGTLWLLVVAPWVLWLGFTLFVLLGGLVSLIAPLFTSTVPSSAKTKATSFVAGFLLGFWIGGGSDDACK